MQKTSYEVRISDWSSDVCSSDLQSVESSMLNQQLLLPYQAVAGMVFGGIKALLDPRIPKERQAAALLRLRRYAGLEPRSDERRVGKECVSTWRSRWSQ